MQSAFSRLLSRVRKASSLSLAAGVIALAPALSPALATAAPGGFGATLATPLPAPKQAIVNSVLWKCAGDTCVAPDQGSRAVLVCRSVTKAFGPVTRFSTTAGVISAEDLAKCASK